MKARCHNVNHFAYERYGAKGIHVCDEWMNDYVRFKTDMGDRPDGYTLERIDNSKGYNKENCKWATRKENQTNRSSVKLVNYFGEMLSIAEIARRHNLESATLNSRLKRFNWPLEKAINTPARPIIRKKEIHNGEAQSNSF